MRSNDRNKQPNTLYYQTYYIMEEEKIIFNGHEAVDLGLSVKWATCNIGASNPEEYGDYFAFGQFLASYYRCIRTVWNGEVEFDRFWQR